MSKKTKSNGKFPQKALVALRAVAKDPEAWHAAMADPVGFLKKSGIHLPDGSTIELFEAAFDPENTSYHESEVTHRNYIPSPEPSTGPYVVCPAGTRPVRTPVTVLTCIKWGFYSGPQEWVPDKEFSTYGRFEKTRTPICIQDMEVTTWVTECMPVIDIVKFKKPF